MYTPWVNLLLASGAAHSTTAVDNALNSTVHAVSATVHTVHTTTAHAVSQWDVYRKDLADAVRDILRPVYDWCIDDSLVSSSASVPPFAAPTPPPTAFWNADVAARSSSSSSPSYIPESLPTSSAAPLRKRVPLPTPASRPQPNAVVSGWGRWHIAPPTATPILTSDSRLGPVAIPRVADSQPLPSHSCMSEHGFIGPRLPTSPIDSFNGTELPVPGHTCSPGDRPPKPHYIWTTRPRCPFNNGNLPEHVACPFPVGLSGPKSIFLDLPADPRDPIIDLGPALDSISLHFESVVIPNRRPLQPQRATPIHDSVWFKVGAVVLTFFFVYALYLGPPGEDFERVDLFNIAVDVVVAEFNAATAKVKEIITTFPPLFPPDDIMAAEQTLAPEATVTAVDVVRVSYWDIVKETVTGFFAGIARVVVASWLLVIESIKTLLAAIIGVLVSLGNLLTKMVNSIITGIVGLFTGLWNLARKSIKWVFVATSCVVVSTYVAVRNIVKGSVKIMKGIFACLSLPRFPPRRVTEQPIAVAIQPISLSVQARSPAMNSTNAQATVQPEAGSSDAQNPTRLRSLPTGVADAIRAGNAAPSQVRRAGGRRINMARPVRATGSSVDR